MHYPIMDPSQIVNRLVSSSATATGRIRVRNALNPALFLCALVTIPCFVMLRYVPPHLQTFLFMIGSMPVVVAAIGYLYFMIASPNRLQSEEYLIKKQALDLIQEKGSNIPINPTSLQAISNEVARDLERPS
ncbi:hypothetical protein [Brevundimonas sp.]|uniref:hypothetical protein n=1 Tax=Brevundimonas sp. TaxID=1871086 RepID=UPI00260BA474|nr:hypothetical protein [Brevundimonas sp.]